MPHQIKYPDLKIDYVHFNNYKTAVSFCRSHANAHIEDANIVDGQLVVDVKIITIVY